MITTLQFVWEKTTQKNKDAREVQEKEKSRGERVLLEK